MITQNNKYLSPYLVETNNKNGHLPTDFEGSISFTLSGHMCQNWSNTAYASVIGLNHNHCRSPDNDLLGAWCYTMNEKIRWDYCAFPIILNGNYLHPSYFVITNNLVYIQI